MQRNPPGLACIMWHVPHQVPFPNPHALLRPASPVSRRAAPSRDRDSRHSPCSRRRETSFPVTAAFSPQPPDLAVSTANPFGRGNLSWVPKHMYRARGANPMLKPPTVWPERSLPPVGASVRDHVCASGQFPRTFGPLPRMTEGSETQCASSLTAARSPCVHWHGTGWLLPS